MRTYDEIKELRKSLVGATSIEELEKLMVVNNHYEVFEISKELGEQIIETRSPLGSFMYEDKINDCWVGIDNKEGNAWTEECDYIHYLTGWLVGDVDDDAIRRTRERQLREKRIKKSYEEGNHPVYFEKIEGHTVENKLISIDFEEEVCHENDDTVVIYLDVIEKYLKLCGCKNINYKQIMCEGNPTDMHICISFSEKRKTGILNVEFNDYIFDDIDDRFTVKKQFLLEEKVKLNEDLRVYKVTEIDYFM